MTTKDQILMEVSYAELQNHTNSDFGPERLQRSIKMQPQKLLFIPSVQNGMLTVKANVKGTENTYETLVIFDNVEFATEPTAGHIWIKAVDGADYYVKQLLVTGESCNVRCQCLDFYWRFSVWNHKDKALVGDPPPPYSKNTNRPPVNPTKTSGVCKHLMKVIKSLKSRGLVK